MFSSWVWVEPRSAWQRNQKHQFLASRENKNRQNAKNLSSNAVIIVEYKHKHHQHCQCDCPAVLSGEFSETYDLLLDTDDSLKNKQELKMQAYVLCRKVTGCNFASSQLPTLISVLLIVSLCCVDKVFARNDLNDEQPGN